MNYSMTDEKVIQVITEAKELNNPMVADLEVWLHPQGNKGWYTCQITGKKIRGQKTKAILAEQEELMDWVIDQIEDAESVELVEIEQQIEEGKITERLMRHIQTANKPMKTTTIKCKDCGKERVIKVQDAFQVKRCVDCQKKYRNRRRAERRREKRAQEKAMQQIQEANNQ